MDFVKQIQITSALLVIADPYLSRGKAQCSAHHPLDKLRDQPDSGRYLSQLSNAKRAKLLETPTTNMQTHQDSDKLLHQYQRRVQAVADHSISDNSLGTYTAGWSKFLEFCRYLHIDPSNPPIPYPLLAQDFVVYLREDARPTVAPATADQYVSHLRHALQHYGLINPEETTRTHLLKQILHAYSIEYAQHQPERLTCTVPITFPLLVETIHFAQTVYTGLLHFAVPAALGCAYACSFRPSEYLNTGTHASTQYLATAHLTYAWYGLVAYRADQVSTWPQAYPDAFTLVKDSRKQHVGRAGPFVVFPNPNKQHSICFVRLLTDYIRQAQLTRSDPLFINQQRQLLPATAVRLPLRNIASLHGIDPSRMPLNCIRYGVNVQLPEPIPEFVRLNQGGWSAKTSERGYWMRLFDHARTTQSSVYDPHNIPTPLVESLFAQGNPNTHANPNPPVPAKAKRQQSV